MVTLVSVKQDLCTMDRKNTNENPINFILSLGNLVMEV